VQARETKIMPPARLRKRARLATCLALPSIAAAFHMVQRQPSFTWKPLHAASVAEPPYSSTTRTRPQKKQQPFFDVTKFLENRMALPSSECREEIPTVDSVLRLLPFEGAEVCVKSVPQGPCSVGYEGDIFLSEREKGADF